MATWRESWLIKKKVAPLASSSQEGHGDAMRQAGNWFFGNGRTRPFWVKVFGLESWSFVQLFFLVVRKTSQSDFGLLGGICPWKWLHSWHFSRKVWWKWNDDKWQVDTQICIWPQHSCSWVLTSWMRQPLKKATHQLSQHDLLSLFLTGWVKSLQEWPVYL